MAHLFPWTFSFDKIWEIVKDRKIDASYESTGHKEPGHDEKFGK